MAIRAIVFDIGGVLEYTAPLKWPTKWERQLQLKSGELGERIRDAVLRGAVGEITEQHFYQTIADRLGLDEAQLAAITEDIWTEYLGSFNVELADYFQSLRSRFKTAIISNSFVGARERESAHYHLDEITDLIIYSHEVGISKPEPRIFQMTWEHLGVQPSEMIFLDDVDKMVTAASLLGIHAIQFKNNAQAIADIEACVRAEN